MKKITVMLLLFAFSTAFSQGPKLFRGTVGKFPVTLFLQDLDVGTHADQISGAYKYGSQTGYSLLNGYRNNSGNFVLVELSTANFSGIFTGKLSGKTFSGNWTNDGGTKILPFQLAEVRATAVEISNFKKAIKSKQDEFAGY